MNTISTPLLSYLKKKASCQQRLTKHALRGILKGKPTEGENIKVQFNPSIISQPQIVKDDYFGGFIFSRIREIDNGPSVSEEQQKKIADEIMKNENVFWTTDAGKSMLNDYKLRKKTSG